MNHVPLMLDQSMHYSITCYEDKCKMQRSEKLQSFNMSTFRFGKLQTSKILERSASRLVDFWSFHIARIARFFSWFCVSLYALQTLQKIRYSQSWHSQCVNHYCPGTEKRWMGSVAPPDPPFTWGGCRPPPTHPLSVGLWPPYSSAFS